MNFVFISPHIDDAFLSAGGLIVRLLSKQHYVRIDYIFSISNWTNPNSISGLFYTTDVNTVTLLRKLEEEEIRKSHQYDCEYLDFLDLPLRSMKEFDDPDLLYNKMKALLRSRLVMEDFCFFPIGLDHPDHILMTKIGLELLTDGYNIIFYEDMPYIGFGGRSLIDLSNDWLFKNLEFQVRLFDFPTKQAILRKYSSQVSEEWITIILNYSYSLADNCHYERFWSTKKLLHKFDLFNI